MIKPFSLDGITVFLFLCIILSRVVDLAIEPINSSASENEPAMERMAENGFYNTHTQNCAMKILMSTIKRSLTSISNIRQIVIITARNKKNA